MERFYSSAFSFSCEKKMSIKINQVSQKLHEQQMTQK